MIPFYKKKEELKLNPSNLAINLGGN